LGIRTAAPVTAWAPRKGEPYVPSRRYGLRPQPAILVRGSSRRIMTMRFRLADIRVINRRVTPGLSPAVLFGTRSSKLTNGNVFPLRRPSMRPVGARSVLAGKGSLRRCRALARCAPLWRGKACDGRLRREHFGVGSMGQKQEGQLPPAEKAGRLERKTSQRS
jgi:hypothetical protein